MLQDISLNENQPALLRVLKRRAQAHHFAGKIPRHPRLCASIDTAPNVCASWLVDRRS
jgi:hypothetical protein